MTLAKRIQHTLTATLIASAVTLSAQAGEDAKKKISSWEDTPKKAAEAMIEKYGQPDEMTDQRLVWHDNGPWKRTEVINEAIEHKFPMPHEDSLKQTVPYDVPVDKFDDLAEYDGSVIVERTRGELSARCDKEGANFLALNLAHDIITDKKSVKEARQEYADTVQAMLRGEKPEYMQGLQFDVPSSQKAADADVAFFNPKKK